MVVVVVVGATSKAGTDVGVGATSKAGVEPNDVGSPGKAGGSAANATLVDNEQTLSAVSARTENLFFKFFMFFVLFFILTLCYYKLLCTQSQ